MDMDTDNAKSSLRGRAARGDALPGGKDEEQDREEDKDLFDVPVVLHCCNDRLTDKQVEGLFERFEDAMLDGEWGLGVWMGLEAGVG